MSTVKSVSFRYTDQCKRLIKATTQFGETDENFKICLDFAVSNLLYHSYTDVNSHAVKHRISRLHEKFLIHSEVGKANAFQAVTEKLISIFDKRNGLQKEESFSILALILNLSESGNLPHTYGKPSVSNSDSEDSCLLDWTTYLREDDINCNLLSDSDSELSISELGTANDFPFSEDDFLEDLPDPLLRPPPRDDSGLGISPDSCSGASQHFHVPLLPQDCVSVVPRRERDSSTFYPYWQPKHQKTYGSCPYNLKTMNFTKMWNEHLASQNLFTLIEKKAVLHERNVIKEILWMLSGVKDLFIAQWDGRKFISNSQIHLCNLTSNTLSVVLSEFCEYATREATLQNFSSGILLDAFEHCLTYQAYAQSLQEQLKKINFSICNLDGKLRKGSDYFTLLALRDKIKPVFHQIDSLYCIHTEVCAELSGIDDPFEKACKLLSVLWKLLYHRSLQEENSASLKIILKIFLKTFKPYFTFLEELIILGSFKDPHGEFVVRREKFNATDEGFWDSGYSLRSLPRDIERGFFLEPFLSDILSAGKSLEILNAINLISKNEPFQLHAVKGGMYLKFLQVLQKLISKTGQNKSIPKINEKVDATRINGTIDLSPVPHDPLLEQNLFTINSSTAKFFHPDVNPVYKPVSLKVPESLFTEQYEDTERIIEELEPSTLKPLTISVKKALKTCMKFAYYPLCHRLKKSLIEDHKVMMHLNIMRKYFLMEAGDLMFSFYSEVFEKISRKESWCDVSFLYCALQNAISEDKENCEKLCIFIDTGSPAVNAHQPLSRLNALQLSYEVEWPVSIMLGPKVQNEYYEIFSFLLQIKCAKYLLDGLYSTSLCKYNLQPRSHLIKALLKSKLPREQKIHGMYIIRMRLLFFVNGLHNYIMTRILHSFGLEFIEVLESSRTVDEMISAHGDYLRSLHERCLLDRRISYLKEHIVNVLNLCYNFQTLWLKGIDKVTLEELQHVESQFSKCSNFLNCCFTTPLRRGTYVHLESLVTTMISDTHSFHIFGNRH